MNNYDDMSDFEINEAVFYSFFSTRGGGPDYVGGATSALNLVGVNTYLGAHGIPDERQEKYGELDYCNNPSDALPIIIENKIAIEWFTDGERALCSAQDGDVIYQSTNPLRAAMIVFLMMNGK